MSERGGMDGECECMRSIGEEDELMILPGALKDSMEN